MCLELKMQPLQAPMGWKEFCGKIPPYSIALDGYVKRGPRFRSRIRGPWANFNHHEDVDRLATRATCAQVRIAIMQGLYECFCDTNGVNITVYANDCDQDVALSWALLKHGQEKEFIFNPRLIKLVNIEDIIDTTAGAYPFPIDDEKIKKRLEEIAWVFEPYANFRVSGEIDKRDSSAFVKVIQDIEERVLLFVAEKGKTIPLDTRYETVHRGSNWIVAKEVGLHSKTGIFSDGCHAYAVFRERPNGRFSWVIGRMSIYIPLDLKGLLRRIIEIDDIVDKDDLPGGSNTIIGTSRIHGSKIDPDLMVRLVREFIHEGRKNS